MTSNEYRNANNKIIQEIYDMIDEHREKIFKKHLQKEIIKTLVDSLQEYFLELEKGFSVAGKQKGITIDGKYFIVDLLFYHYLLKCFVLVDIKVNELTNEDIEQMNLKVRHYEKEIKGKDDNPTIGIIICSKENQTVIKYLVLEENKEMFEEKYMCYMPDEEELKGKIKDVREKVEDKVSNRWKINREH